MDKTCSTCEYSTENKHGGLLCLHPEIVASGIVLPVCVDDVCVDWKEDTPMNHADICRECELSQKVQELEESIEGLIKAVNESNFCSACSEEFGNLACSECPWYQAKIKAIRLLVKEEAE